MKTPTGHLTRQVDLWTRQALQAGRFLLRLYRRLQDDRQAAATLAALVPCETRAARQRMDIPSHPPETCAPGEDEALAESRAWETVLEAQIGYCAFHALVDSPRGVKHAAERAYHMAVRGLETAFPKEWTTPRRQAILQEVSTRCADLFLLDLEDEGAPEQRRHLHATIETGIRQGFTRSTAPKGQAHA